MSFRKICQVWFGTARWPPLRSGYSTRRAGHRARRKGTQKDKFVISLIFISFAYSGWNAVAYLGTEIKRPGRNIPLAPFAGTLTVMYLYMLLNIAYVYALPAKDMSGSCFIFGISGIFFWWKGKRIQGKISQELQGPSQKDK